MSRIASTFAKLERRREPAFIPYITCGFPSLAVSERLAEKLAASGADLIELGVPFSDPIADGPTIQRSSYQALVKGTTLTRVLSLVTRLRKKISTPLVLFTYYNPLLRYSLARFVNEAAARGADGVLVPDLPPEEARELIALARRKDFDTVFLIAPTSTEARIRRAAEASSSFVYAVSLTGVTGARSRLPEELPQWITQARRMAGKPLVVGFGVSTPEMARAAAKISDGVVVGSVLVSALEKALSRGRSEKSALESVARLAGKLARAAKGI